MVSSPSTSSDPSSAISILTAKADLRVASRVEEVAAVDDVLAKLGWRFDRDRVHPGGTFEPQPVAV
jgi:hypothetical protein